LKQRLLLTLKAYDAKTGKSEKKIIITPDGYHVILLYARQKLSSRYGLFDFFVLSIDVFSFLEHCQILISINNITLISLELCLASLRF